jgi:sugar lactone lactonase YvrE
MTKRNVRFTPWLASLAFVALQITSTHPSAQPGAPAPQQLFAEATAAYRDKAFGAYLEKVRTLAELRPTHPTILYKLAGACALNGRPDDAARALDRLTALQLVFDVNADNDFSAVRENAVVIHAVERMDAVPTRRIGDAAVAWTIDDPKFIPEGITYDAASRSFFVSSQYQRRIVRVDSSRRVSSFVGEAQDGLWMTFGIGVDAKRRLLWAVSTAEPVMKGFTERDANRAGLFAFRLDTGALARKITVEPDTPAHYFDDLTIRSDGRVFLSDGGHGIIYTVAPDGRDLETLVPRGMIQGPNGLALTEDERTLYVADYAGFIIRVDIESRATTRISGPPDATIYGIDGLSYYRGTLIGVQNGVTPPRVVRLTLSKDGTAIDAVRILEMNHPSMGEPTLGVVADGAFYFVADSQGGVLRASKGDLAKQTLTSPTILRLALQ